VGIADALVFYKHLPPPSFKISVRTMTTYVILNQTNPPHTANHDLSIILCLPIRPCDKITKDAMNIS